VGRRFNENCRGVPAVGVRIHEDRDPGKTGGRTPLRGFAWAWNPLDLATKAKLIAFVRPLLTPRGRAQGDALAGPLRSDADGDRGKCSRPSRQGVLWDQTAAIGGHPAIVDSAGGEQLPRDIAEGGHRAERGIRLKKNEVQVQDLKILAVGRGRLADGLFDLLRTVLTKKRLYPVCRAIKGGRGCDVQPNIAEGSGSRFKKRIQKKFP